MKIKKLIVVNGSALFEFNNREIDSYKFNGKPAIKLVGDYNTSWYKVPYPFEVEKKVPEKRINHRFKVNDDIGFLPETLEAEKDAEYGWVLPDEWVKYENFYDFVWDKKPECWEKVEWSFGEVEEYSLDVMDPKSKYKVLKKVGYEERVDDAKIIYHPLDELVFSEPMLPHRPCMVSSVELFAIVRKYVKDNINPKCARITSDYDFSLTVEKRYFVPEYKIRNIRYTKSGKVAKRQPPPSTKKEKEFTILDISTDGRFGRQLENITAENKIVLEEKIDALLEEIITKINTPLKQCGTCSGLGVINDF